MCNPFRIVTSCNIYANIIGMNGDVCLVEFQGSSMLGINVYTVEKREKIIN